MPVNPPSGTEAEVSSAKLASNRADRELTRNLTQLGLEQWSIPCSPHQLEQLMRFRDLLLEWNAQRMNLTRLTSPREIAAEHFLDSASLLTAVNLRPGSSLLDIGAGAGFPSLPLAILRPDLRVTLLEATAKKLAFCEAAARSAGLDMQLLRFIHGRAEEESAWRQVGQRFDLVTARAVAPLIKLAPWCAAYLKRPKGVFVALKGALADDEVSAARDTLDALRLVAEVRQVNIPQSDRAHMLVVCRPV